MSRSLNEVKLIGHLGQDAETKFTPSGISVSTFSLATSRRWKPEGSDEWKEETDWHRCTLWRNENLAPYLKKGKQIYVSGRLQTRKYDDNAGVTRWVTEVVVQDVILCGGGGSGERPPHPASAPANATAAGPVGDALGITDDDVPF
jgi:single-strand DNA-binding protein